MTSGSSNSNTSSSQAENRAAAVTPVVHDLNQFAEWLDRELESMLRENADWQTFDTVRKYFGR